RDSSPGRNVVGVYYNDSSLCHDLSLLRRNGEFLCLNDSVCRHSERTFCREVTRHCCRMERSCCNLEREASNLREDRDISSCPGASGGRKAPRGNCRCCNANSPRERGGCTGAWEVGYCYG